MQWGVQDCTVGAQRRPLISTPQRWRQHLFRQLISRQLNVCSQSGRNQIPDAWLLDLSLLWRIWISNWSRALTDRSVPESEINFIAQSPALWLSTIFGREYAASVTRPEQALVPATFTANACGCVGISLIPEREYSRFDCHLFQIPGPLSAFM